MADQLVSGSTDAVFYVDTKYHAEAVSNCSDASGLKTKKVRLMTFVSDASSRCALHP